MKVMNYKDQAATLMNGETVKNVAARVMIGRNDGADKFCMRVFEIEKNGFTPMHSHDWEHEVFVHAGQGRVFIEDGWHDISAGSTIFVPPNVDHQFKNTSDDTMTFICVIPAGAPEL